MATPNVTTLTLFFGACFYLFFKFPPKSFSPSSSSLNYSCVIKLSNRERAFFALKKKDVKVQIEVHTTFFSFWRTSKFTFCNGSATFIKTKGRKHSEFMIWLRTRYDGIKK